MRIAPTYPLRNLRGLMPRARALIRASEVWLVVVAAGVGVIAGALVTGMSHTSQFMHQVLFGIEHETRLSQVARIEPIPGALVPAIGGLLMGVMAIALMRWRPRQGVDPIEANALRGGRMSLTDSLIVAVQTLISNGFGGSVGLEAGYTQISSGVASRLGLMLRLRRNDLRVLVGCGAAGAIAAAFDAPVTGAFYGFELIIGTYTVATVAPVMAAALAATLTARALGGAAYSIQIAAGTPVEPIEIALLIVLAIICAHVGIVVMRAVTLTETLFRRSHLPGPVRPVIGGAVVGALALITPAVLSSGHGAIHTTLTTDMSLTAAGLVLLLKMTATSISLGSGFRGGLFFASLFLGALVGQIFADICAMAGPWVSVDPVAASVVGMGALAVAIIGGPLTMAFLALETTGDFALTVVVLGAAIIAGLTVRETFGYSFSTWRFHLRGETIRSAHDVGWIRSLTVERLMRPDAPMLPSDATVAEFRQRFPLGSTQRVVAIDPGGRYAGMVSVPEAHAPELDEAAETTGIEMLLHNQDDMLVPSLNVKEAVAIFDRSESEALAVVDGWSTRRVIGLLTEAHAMRRYVEELDKARRDLAGEG